MSERPSEQTDSSPPTNEVGAIDPSSIDGRVVDTLDTVAEPTRSVEQISTIFKRVRHGDNLKIVFGTASYNLSLTGEVVGIKGVRSSRPPDTGWTRTIEVHGPEGDGKNGRLYRMGCGGEKADPWLLYSYPYYPELGMLETDDAGFHGWIVDVQRVPEEW